ncbi:hypothetical protein OFC13_28225, partial [Escherichia coli]|nr:hypothetical protein [Escherichia coli]
PLRFSWSRSFSLLGCRILRPDRRRLRAGDGAEESRVELKVELSLCGVSSAAALDLREGMVWMDGVDVRRDVQTGTAGRSDRGM